MMEYEDTRAILLVIDGGLSTCICAIEVYNVKQKRKH